MCSGGEWKGKGEREGEGELLEDSCTGERQRERYNDEW
jgi:hypothetical protein